VVTWPADPQPAGPPKAGRRRSTSRDDIANVAIELFAARGFDAVSVDDVARAAGISRRSLFRYYASKNAILWGDFDTHLGYLGQLLDEVQPQVPLRTALRDALLAFNTFDDSEVAHHRQRMRVILETAELQAYSMTMYAGWREVIARYVASRYGAKATDLVPQTTAWTLLGVALSAYEHWVADESSELADALTAAFDVVAPAFDASPF
jgi:TetR/AcrR family transcriptional regulator, regulator of mycofactocin system